MNKDQALSLIRTVLKWGSGLLMAHGMTKTGGWLVGEEATAIITLLVSAYCSHQNNAAPVQDASDKQNPPAATAGQ